MESIFMVYQLRPFGDSDIFKKVFKHKSSAINYIRQKTIEFIFRDEEDYVKYYYTKGNISEIIEINNSNDIMIYLDNNDKIFITGFVIINDILY